MKWISYSKFSEEDLGIDTEDLVRALADYFLQSGFNDPYLQFSELNQQTLEDLKRAIEQALASGELFDPEQAEQMRQRLNGMTEAQRENLIQKLMEKLEQGGYINTDGTPPDSPSGTGSKDGPEREAQFQVTDKAIDFLGFKTLKDLLGSLGKSSFGAHETRDLATGIDASGGAKNYEFGDTLNLDVSATLFSAMQREGVKLPLNLEYSDLYIHQSEYQSSCATVLLLDCSHSMILYGEDRFTPAKKVALALSHLIRTQYPGDSLRCVLFHDSAEELRISELARVQVGPYYTNTRDGLILA
ncbi:MAG TPA: hypothetical protein VGE93_19920, partial [Bryobacteraceae bacterium]